MNNLTKAQRANVSKAFLAAKQLLWDGADPASYHNEYICHSLMRAENTSKDSAATYKLAKAIIDARLEGEHTLDNWLRKQGIKDGLKDHVQLQAHRHAWLDKLAEEFSH